MRLSKLFLLMLIWFIWVSCILWFSVTAQAADASFSWRPNSEPDLAGYKIHYGPASRQYETVVDVGLPDLVGGRVVYALPGVPDGTTYFSATAYDTGGLESDYSAEVVYNPAPAAPADPRIVKIVVTVELSQ